MKNKIINYFFDTKEEYETYKLYIKIFGVLVVINIIAIIF